MQYERKYFGNGSGNFDDADFVLAPNQWVNMENCRVRSTDKGVIGTVESVGSTVLLSEIQPSITFTTIGAVADLTNNRLIYFQKDIFSNNDKIVCYFLDSQIEYTVLRSIQVTGGFGFDKNHIIHSARVINGILYWTDNINQPRAVNIDAGIKLNDPTYDTDAEPYSDPIDFSQITLIKPPPQLAPDIIKEVDGSVVNNFIANESFRFAYRYIYYDNETTVVGTYSPGSRLNAVTDTYNRIVVRMDVNEIIPQRVRIVQLIVGVGFPSITSAYVVKSWDKEIEDEAIEIEDQNDGTTRLTYNFYNTSIGPFLASDQILKPFDSVPLTTQTIEAGKNRLFLGNNVEGYDTPTASSLSATQITVPISGSSLTKTLISVEWLWWNFVDGVLVKYRGAAYSGWYIYINNGEITGLDEGYYALTATEQSVPPDNYTFEPDDIIPVLPTPPATITTSDITFRGLTQSDVLDSTNYDPEPFVGHQERFTSFTVTAETVEITGVSVSTYNVFKSRSQYNLGVVFYDFALRKCGVVFNGTVVNIPARDFAYSEGVSNISWTLSNNNALDEIPDWAYYYCVVRTLNLKTRFFIQAFDDAAKYATKDADGVYVFTETTFDVDTVGIAIDTTALVQAGLGYAFAEGDICIITLSDDSSYELPVIDQQGKYIIVKSMDIGDLSGAELIYEVYTPYQTSTEEPYFEIGQMYRVLSPGTDSRRYETTSDLINSDAYVLTRNFQSDTYFAETMSPNDLFYNRWDNDIGKPNIITKLGQIHKPQNISYSDVYLPGTAVNGLSTFEALNEQSLPPECGPIQKLQLTSKVNNEQGVVMLAICKLETSSLYLSEARIIDNTGDTQFIASSTSVIGTVNNLKGSFGTINPESVVEFRGNVYWVDVLNGKVIQYSLNGLFPISNYKMTRYWKLFSDQYLSMTAEQIEALGSRPFIFTTVDPHHWELLITVPRVLATPPMGYLPDTPYTSYVYPFDIWDGMAKTLVYKINAEPNFWQGSYSFAQEGYLAVQNKLYSFKHGQLYEHNDTSTYCNFNGTQYKSRIMFIANQEPERPKVYNNMSVESNMTPTLTYFMSIYPYTQVSNLQDFDWENKEGILYSQIYRNVLTPSATGLQANALVTGEKMRTNAFRVLLEFTVSTTPLELRFATLGYLLSLGHSIPTQ